MVLSKRVQTACRLPAKRQINRQGELVFEILVSPAPRRLKPLAEIPNPYPYGCSVLCRHPRDPELRHVIWHSQKSPKEHAVSSRATNEAFQRWPTKRLASLAGSALSLRSIPCSKRSRTPDFRRQVLTFDLRPWRSFDCLSSTTLGRTLDENEIKQEDFELLSPQDAVPPTRSRVFRNKQEFNSARPRIQQNEVKKSGPRRSAAKQATKNPAKSSSNQTEEILERQMLLDGKCEAVDLKQDSNEESAPKEEDQDPDPTPHSSESEPLVNDTEDPVHEEISEIIPESIPEKQQSQSQLKGVPSLEEIMKTLQIDSTVTQFAVPSPGENPERNWVRFSRNEHFFSNLPRAGKYFGARFELPMDLRLLQDLSPLEYLRRFTVSSRCRKRLNESVFLRYSRNKAIEFQDLWIALSEILGFPISQQFQDQFQDLVKISGSENFSLDEFHGLSAAAERLCRREVSQREELEKADFQILFNKYLDTSFSESLKDFLVFVNNS